MAISGGCLCGALRYEISGSFKGAGHCHCSICRKAHGAAFVTWAHIDPAQFRWVSATDTLGKYESSPGMRRCFCMRCGSPLASELSGKISEIVLGNVDGDAGVRPAEHIFVGSKAPWHEVSDGLPQFKEWPPMGGGVC